MTIAKIIGFELGDGGELAGGLGTGSSVVTTPVRTGNYALKATNTANIVATALSATKIALRAYINFTAIPGATTDVIVERIAGPTNRLHLEMRTTGVLALREGPGTTLGLVTAVGTKVLSTGKYYQIEIALDCAAGGVVKLWIDGVIEINTTHPTDATASPTFDVILLGPATPNESFYDDVRLDTATVTQIGAGQGIARQGTAGAPTYDAWTKTGLATAAACWSETPFSATNNCNSATAAQAQTMLLASFAAAQTGHGLQVLNSSAVINAAKIMLVGKTSSVTTDGADSIRRRVAAADTDTAIPVYTVSDAYYDSGIITGLTYANLTDGTTEIGIVHGTGTNTHTVEDMWLYIDFTPASVAEMTTLYGYQPPMIMDDSTVVDY